MPVVLKLKHQGEVRRTQLQEEEITYELVRETILKIWPELGSAMAKYHDEEGDLCVLCPASFSDFLTHAQGSEGQRLFKLELLPPASPSPLPPLPPASASPATPEVREAPRTSQTAPQQAQGEGAWPWSWDMPWADQGAAPWQHIRSSLPRCWGGWQKDSQEWLLKPGKMLWVLAGLRATDGLSGKSAASLVVHFLPRLISNITERPDKVEGALRANLPCLQPLLEDLRELASHTVALEHCSASLSVMIADEATPRTEAVLSLLLSLSELPFETQVAFAEELYNSRHVQELLDWVRLSTPNWAMAPLEHSHVTCDGCSVSPLRGLRFKCQACPDYDLCGECFVKKGSIHGGEVADHGFQCTIVDWGFMWKKKQEEMAALMPTPLAKGMTKGAWEMRKAMKSMWAKGCKGKGKGMGWWSEAKEGKGTGKGAADRYHNEATNNGCGSCAARGSGGTGEVVAEPEAQQPPAAAPDEAPRPQAARAEAASGGGGGAAKDAPGEAPVAANGEPQQAPPAAGPPAAGGERGPGAEAAGAVRPCPGGCGFQATWHPTHCCRGCEARGEHGPACQRRPVVPEVDGWTVVPEVCAAGSAREALEETGGAAAAAAADA